MILIEIDKISLHGKTYKNFVEYLISNADSFTFEINEEFNVKYPNIKKIYSKRHGVSMGSWMHIGITKVYPDILREILLSFDSVDEWDTPEFFEDLCLFKKDKCIFASVYHKDIFLMYEEDKSTLDKIKNIGFVFRQSKEKEKYRPTLP